MKTLLVATDESLLLVRRWADEWQSEVKEVRGPRCLAADPHDPGRFYCGTEADGLWRSADAGRTWEPAGDGIEQRQITAVAVNGHEIERGLGVVYAGTEPSRMYRSTDGGDTWALLPGLNELPSAGDWAFPPRPWTHHVRWIEPHATQAGPLFVAIEAGALVRTLDGGQTWRDRVPGGPYDTHTLSTHPATPDVIRSAAGDGYFESHDGGDTWQRPRQGLNHGYLVGIITVPADPESVLVSGSTSPRTAYDPQLADSYIYRKVGEGPWQSVRAGLPEPRGMTVNIFAAHPDEARTLYSANNHGLFRSADSGETWERVAVAWPDALRQQRVHALVVAEVV